MTEKTVLTAPSLEEAKQLYEVVVRVKELAPWAWMDESEIFGVQNPETGELGFVSIMGMAGEHFAIAVYQGAEGLYDFLDMESGEALMNPQRLLEIPELQASFEDRDMLDKQDREVIKKLGLKFRGANAWPMFRSYRPGYLPWFVTTEEARFLTHALEQVLEVAPRVKDDPKLLYGRDDEDDMSFFVRVPHPSGEGLDWEDRMMRVPRPVPVRPAVVLNVEVIGQLKKLPHRDLELEIDFFGMPTPVGEKGERPHLPYLLMSADGRSGMILGLEMMVAENSLAEMQGQVPMKLALFLAKAGVVPAEIRVRSELMLELLTPLAKTLALTLRHADSLPMIDAAMDSMFDWMMGGEF